MENVKKLTVNVRPIIQTLWDRFNENNTELSFKQWFKQYEVKDTVTVYVIGKIENNHFLTDKFTTKFNLENRELTIIYAWDNQTNILEWRYNTQTELKTISDKLYFYKLDSYQTA